MAEPADRIPPAQKTYNYHKPAEEPFRAPPVQKTFNYFKAVQDGPATPPRAEGPRSFGSTPVGSMPKAPDTFLNKAGDFFFPDAFRPLPNSRKSNFAADMASPLLGSAYDLASTATTMTPDPNSYVPVPVQRLNHYLSNMGIAGLSALAAPVYGAAGLAADVANKLGVPRPDALARDLGAMLDSAGILPEGRMLAAMIPDAPAPRISRAPEDIPTQTPAETIINQTDVAPVAPPAAEPFYGPLPPPPNFLMDRPEGYDPFATLRPQNNREATPPAAATNLGGRTPEEFNAELDRIFGPDNRTPDQIAADLEDLRRQNEVDYGLERLGNVTGPDTEAYAALEAAYDNEVPEPNEIDRIFDPDDRTPEQRANDAIDRHLDEVLPTLLERAQRGDPLTDQEAFDVMTFERYGADGVYDPTNTLENWGQQTNNDMEGVERIGFLTGANRTRGQDPVAFVEGPYFGDDPEFIGFDDDTDYDVTGYPPPPELHTMTPYRTLEELSADPEYQNLITADTLTTEQAQRLLDATFDEYLHRVDAVSPPDDTSYYDIMTRLEYLTGSEGYRAYAEGMGDPPTRRPQLRPDISSRIRARLKPLTEEKTGIASMYSPTRRAVEQLRQSRFPDPVSMEKQLLAMGAKPDELEILLKKIGTSDVAEGGIKKLRMAELADEVSNSIQQFRGPDILYGRRHLEGGTDPHVTTFEAPVNDVPKHVQGNQHFTPKLPGSAVLAHIRSAMFKTPGSASNNVYHLGEIQSDWAQFRAKLFSNNDEYLKAEAEKDKLWKHVQNLSRIGYTHDGSLGNYAQAEAKIRKLEDRIGATDTYGFREYFDEDFPAPYVKTTRKWHQLGLKQALIEAVNSGADYMSMSTGKQVKSYTHGKLEGQQKFYDEMTPREFDDILTKFSKEAGVEKPVIEQITIEGEDSGFTWPPAAKHTVPAIRLTDEFKEAMKKYGLPSFAKGGLVTLPT